MASPVRLDNVAHAALRVHVGHGARFGDAVNQVAVFVDEFEAVQREYPILFQRDGEGLLQALAIVGLDPDENLFLADSGWDGDYVPALLRRGPFAIGLAPNGEPVVHVVPDHPRIAADGGGVAVFLPHGGQAPVLGMAMDALRTIHLGVEAAPLMTETFDALGLIEPVRLRVNLSDTQVYEFEDYLALSADRMAGLDGAALERLSKAGLLAPAIHAAGSLGNMNRLIRRKRARGG